MVQIQQRPPGKDDIIIIYPLIALINAVYGILLLFTLSQSTPGFFLILFIGSVLTLLGISGLIYWLVNVIGGDARTSSPGMRSWLQIAKGIDILLVLGLLFRAFILQPFIVEGSSMEVNFHNREFLLVDRISYKFTVPKRGEVIIFKFPKNPAEDYIKRIIGLPGEAVEIKEGKVFINGAEIPENYLPENTQTITGNRDFQTSVGPSEFFVLGDNRGNSSDSREWGMVPKENIIGRAWLEVYPLSDFGLIKNPQTVVP